MNFERFCWVMWAANVEECLECGNPMTKLDDYIESNKDFLTEMYSIYLKNAETKIPPTGVHCPPE